MNKRDFGPQPLAGILEALHLQPNDLVRISERPLTHKMIARGTKGRWLTPNIRDRILLALNKASGRAHGRRDLFNYEDAPAPSRQTGGGGMEPESAGP